MSEERTKEFLECLGRGKTIYECEAENDKIDFPPKQKVICKCGDTMFDDGERLECLECGEVIYYDGEI